jgi:hypothetical protein
MPSEIRGSSNFDSDSAGKVLQVVTHRSDSKGVYSTGNEHFPTEWSITVTPKSATSMLILTCSLSLETSYNTTIKINKNGSVITDSGYEGYNSIAGNQRWSGFAFGDIYDTDVATTPNTKTFQYFVPSGNTSARSYDISVRTSDSTNKTLWVNRSANNGGADDVENGVSVMTVMEIAQ